MGLLRSHSWLTRAPSRLETHRRSISTPMLLSKVLWLIINYSTVLLTNVTGGTICVTVDSVFESHSPSRISPAPCHLLDPCESTTWLTRLLLDFLFPVVKPNPLRKAKSHRTDNTFHLLVVKSMQTPFVMTRLYVFRRGYS